MADAVATQIVYDGPGEVVVKLTNISDGTGESAVTKIDVSTLDPPPGEVTLKRIVASTAGMSVDLLWDADTDVLAWHIPADETASFEFPLPIQNNAGTGRTGDLKLTTIGHTAADRYTIYLHCLKRTV